VDFTVPLGKIGTPIQGPGSVDLSSSDLNGTVLAGQSLSLDLMFTNDVLARVGLVDASAFGLLLIIDTNAETFPGFVGTTTGYLLDPSRGQFGSTQVAGRSDSCCPGSLAAGLVSFASDNLAGAQIGDISGVHFDTSLPNNGFVITDVELAFVFNSPYDGVEFGSAQQLPEPSTLGLTLAGVLLIAFVAWHRGLKQLFHAQ